MAEEIPDYDDIYIFSKDRRRSLSNLNGHSSTTNYASINDDYIYVSPPRYQIDRSSLNSLPNLKETQPNLFKRPFYSESDPLLSGRRRCRSRYLCAQNIHFPRYKRTQIFLFFYIVLYVGYLLLGSICFQKLETTAEQKVREKFRTERIEFLKEHPQVKGDFWFARLFMRCARNGIIDFGETNFIDSIEFRFVSCFTV